MDNPADLREVDSRHLSQDQWLAITDAFDEDKHVQFEGQWWQVSSVLASGDELEPTHTAVLRKI